MEKLYSKGRTKTCNCFLISSGSSSCWSQYRDRLAATIWLPGNFYFCQFSNFILHGVGCSNIWTCSLSLSNSMHLVTCLPSWYGILIRNNISALFSPLLTARFLPWWVVAMCYLSNWSINSTSFLFILFGYILLCLWGDKTCDSLFSVIRFMFYTWWFLFILISD